MKKPDNTILIFEEKKGKNGQTYMRGIGDDKNYYLFLDRKKNPLHSTQKIWNLVIKNS